MTSRLPSTSRLRKGARIGQYAIDGVLGSGGFGITYLAHDKSDHLSVAIKEFFPSGFAYRQGARVILSGELEQSDFVRAVIGFVEEGLKLKDKFSHQHIVQGLDIVTKNETAYIVMEHLDGRP